MKISYNTQKLNKADGFTLLELSIVVLIIGIILGGVLMFMDIKEKGQSKAIISEMTSTKAALSAFIDKYKYRPGDIPIADKYFTSTDCANTNGDGDNEWEANSEYNTIWSQFYQAGMIDQKATFTCPTSAVTNAIPGTNRPASKFTGAGWTFLESASVDSQTFFKVLRVGGPSGNLNMSQAIIPITIHKYIDSKLDVEDTPKSGLYFVGETACLNGSADDFNTNDNLKCTGNMAEISNVASFIP